MLLCQTAEALASEGMLDGRAAPHELASTLTTLRIVRTQSSGRLIQMSTLRLEIVGPQASALGAAASKVFRGSGGSIGRAPDNDWVIPDPYISGHHARIHWRNGQYLLEDTSSNGVFLGSSDRRLPWGEFYALQNGDRIFIDAYEIRVGLVAAKREPDAFDAPTRDVSGPISEDPFSADPFPPSTPAPRSAARPHIPDDFSFGGQQQRSGTATEENADPLKLLGLDAKRPPAKPAPRAQDLARGSPLNDHYEPPSALTTPLKEPSAAVVDALIPEGYDPLGDDVVPPVDSFGSRAPSPPRPTPGQRSAVKPARRATPANPPPQVRERPISPPVRPPSLTTPRQESGSTGQIDFSALLAGAGLRNVQVTPEFAENLGRILRVVVGGLMEVLHARERIKTEFRLRTTTFKTTDNNPLKFSANVEDALHNLLVKRNNAYLAPAEAFEDALNDVRNHQMAMLAGVRVAFDAMLAEFDPEHLQEDFDGQTKKASLLSGPARLRYWELYREKFQEMGKDPESNFRELFGDEFARAYEEQLKSLKAPARAPRK
jgi:type VI secretion system FHA domain protein